MSLLHPARIGTARVGNHSVADHSVANHSVGVHAPVAAVSPVGTPIGVWFNGSVPDRIVHETERFRVVSPARETARGWRFLAVGDSGSIRTFEIESDAGSPADGSAQLDAAHWTLATVETFDADAARW